MPARAAAALFDLDGTLLVSGGAGRRAMDEAVREVLGVAEGIGQMRLDGMTDRAIIRTALTQVGRPCSEAEIDRALARYLELLTENLATTPEYRVLPGVDEAVRALHGRGVAVGLGTGNIEPGARVKLERSGLNPLLPFGGFGSDAEDRAALLKVGVERAGQVVGRPLRAAEVWIIGDTPKDIDAAKRIGAPVLAVAAARYSVEELRAHQPDAVVPDLTHPEALAILLG